MSDDPVEERVIAALEDDRFRWRTVRGIVAQTSLSTETVLEALAKLTANEKVIRSLQPSRDGEDLYTTRDHYRRSASFTERLSAAFRNRAS